MQRIGPYRVVAELGRGGMAVVFRAEGPGGEDVAIKVLHRTEDLVQRRFAREAKVLAKLEHPGIVPLLDVGEHQGVSYFVMPFVPGQSLGQALLDRQRLPPLEAAEVARAVAEALSYAHAHGVLHRDLKPDNVLLGVNGQPQVIDFGLARPADATSRLSRTGALMGTPGYMAPEQVHGETEVDEVTDVYGIGAVLYAALTGGPPIEGDTLVEVLGGVVEGAQTPPSALAEGVEPELDAICMRSLAKDPVQRYGSARAFEAALATYLAHARAAGAASRATRLPLFAAALVVVTLFTAGAAAWLAIGRGEAVVSVEDAHRREREQRLERATQLHAAERWEQALAELGAPQDPAWAASESLRAQLHLELEELPAALAAIERGLSVQPDSAELFLLRAEAQAKDGAYAEGLRAAERAVELGGGFPARMAEARIYAYQGDFDGAKLILKELISAYPEEVDGWQALVGVHGMQRSPQGVVDVARRGLEQFPGDEALLRALCAGSELSMDFRGVREAVDQLVGLGFATPRDHLQRARARNILRDGRGAISDAVCALSHLPANHVAYRELAMGLTREGRREEALVLAECAAALLPDPRSEAAVHLGMLWVRLQEAERAIATLTPVCEREDLSSPVPLVTLAEAQIGLGKNELALPLLERALRLPHPEKNQLRGMRGAVFVELGRYEEALADLRAALLSQPDNSRLLTYQAAALGGLRQRRAAREVLRKVRIERLGAGRTLEVFAGAAANLKEHLLAVQALEQVVPKYPNEPKLHVRLAEQRLALGRYPAALEAAERAARLGASDRLAVHTLTLAFAKGGKPKVALNYALSFDASPVGTAKRSAKLAADVLEHELYPLAKALYRELCKRHPNSVELHVGHSMARLSLLELPAAIDACSRALELAPGSIPALRNRAMCSMLLSELGAAAIDIAEVVNADPLDAEGWGLYADLLRAFGRIDDARAAYRFVLQLKGTGPSADFAREQLEVLEVYR